MQVSLKHLKELQQCGSVAECIAKAKELGVDITEQQAQKLLGKDLADDMSAEELENVAGGGCTSFTTDTCPYCGSEEIYIEISGDPHCKACGRAI